MRLSMEEKQALYDYACPNHRNTVTRLKWVTALTVDPERKRRMLALARKIDTEEMEQCYPCFYRCLRSEMERYHQAKQYLHLVETGTDYEEDMYDEAV